MVRARRLMLVVVGLHVLIAAGLVLLAGGCATTPAPVAAPAESGAARDPEVWRPARPAKYPEARE